MKLYLVRHGYPDYEKDSLTKDRGVYEAMGLAEYLKDVKFDKIYASTNGRARETADYVANKIGFKGIIESPWAREDCGGKYFVVKDIVDGKEINQWTFWQKEYARGYFEDDVMEYGYKWYDHPKYKNEKFKEGVLLMNKWVDDFMLELGYKHDRNKHIYEKVKETPEVVGLFAHGAFAFSFLSSLLEIPYPIFVTRMSCLDTSCYAVIEFVDGYASSFPFISKYNENSHLKNFDELKKCKDLKQ